MRRLLPAVAVAAFLAALAAGSWRPSAPFYSAAYADTNGICLYSPSPVQTGVVGQYNPLLGSCDTSHNLNVNIVNGGGGSGASTIGYYNPSPSPAPAATALPVLTDPYGQIILSPMSQTQAAPGWFNPSPVPLGVKQQAPANLDQFGNLQVNIVATMAPGPATLNDYSGQVATAATAQPALLPNAARTSFTICDPPTQYYPIWINDVGAGTSVNSATMDQRDIEIFPGQCYTPDGHTSQGQIDIISSGTPTYTAHEVQ